MFLIGDAAALGDLAPVRDLHDGGARAADGGDGLVAVLAAPGPPGGPPGRLLRVADGGVLVPHPRLEPLRPHPPPRPRGAAGQARLAHPRRARAHGTLTIVEDCESELTIKYFSAHSPELQSD